MSISKSSCRAIGFYHFSKYNLHLKNMKWGHIQSLTTASNKARSNVQKSCPNSASCSPQSPCFFHGRQEKFLLLKPHTKPQSFVLVLALHPFALPCSVSFVHPLCTRIVHPLIKPPAVRRPARWPDCSRAVCTRTGCLSGCHCCFAPGFTAVALQSFLDWMQSGEQGD